MNHSYPLALLLALPLTLAAEEPKPIKALLLTGGGFHDYNAQKLILTEGLSARANIEWTIVHEEAEPTKKLLQENGWADGVDVVVYNMCHADEKDGAFVESLTKTHSAGLPAVMIHCALHSYHWRTDNDAWVTLLGAKSMRHGAQHPISVSTTAADHPIMKLLPKQWDTPKGELYHIDKVLDSATVLATGTIDNGATTHPVAWTNQLGKARVFTTSIGHHNETMQDKNYLDMVTSGLLWSVDKLNADGSPKPGFAAKK